MRFADLHLHTTHSDGVRSPGEVVELALRHSLSIIAISDHDQIAAFDEIASDAAGSGILSIPAVELSCAYRGIDVHLLAYAFDPQNAPLQRRLEQFREVRRDRGRQMVENLVACGIPITLERVAELCGGGAMGRPHVARALVEAGVVTTIDEAFVQWLGPGCPGFASKARFDVSEAVDVIHRAGGVLSIAHPTIYPDDRRIVPEILDLGVDGIEVFHPQVDLESQRFYDELARYRGALVTGGSDDHGFEGRCDIGTIRVPEERITPILERVEIRA